MATLTTNPVHSRNRRRLGKNQFPSQAPVSVAVTSSGTTNATLTFSRPVIVTGNLHNTVATRTLVSQTQVSPTVVTQVWNGNVAGLAYAVPGGDPSVGTYQGGQVAGQGGTFP